MKCVIADAGPIIVLCKVNHLKLLNLLFKNCFITESVYKEVTSGNDSAVSCLQIAVKEEQITIESPTSVIQHLENILDIGEATSISLAKEKLHCVLLIDEAKGRQIAKQMNLAVIGLAGILILSKKKQFIECVMPLLRKIRQNGYWLTDRFLQEIAKMSGEKPDD